MVIIVDAGYFTYGSFSQDGSFWGKTIFVDVDLKHYYSYGSKFSDKILVEDDE